MSKQPKDDANIAIPVLGYRPHSGQQIAFGAAAVLSSEIFRSVQVISIYATDTCFIEIGDADTVASLTTSHIVPGGVYMDISLGDIFTGPNANRYVSVISSNIGTLYLSERQ